MSLLHEKPTDSMFLANFRLRAQNWLVNNGDKELTMEDAHHLSSKRTLASEEFLLKDDNPMLKQNLTSLLRKVMQEDSSTWDDLRFLDQMKESNPGFNYQVKYDVFGRLEAVFVEGEPLQDRVPPSHEYRYEKYPAPLLTECWELSSIAASS